MRKKIKKVFRFIKDFFFLVSNVRQLETDVENLENKLLAPEKVDTGSMWSRYLYSFSLWGNEPGRRITLEEKVDALVKALNVEFEWKEEQDKQLVAKIKKETKKKK